MMKSWYFIALFVWLLLWPVVGCGPQTDSNEPHSWKKNLVRDNSILAPAYHEPVDWWRINHRFLVGSDLEVRGRYFSRQECSLCHERMSCRACHEYVGASVIGD